MQASNTDLDDQGIVMLTTDRDRTLPILRHYKEDRLAGRPEQYASRAQAPAVGQQHGREERRKW